MARFPDEFEALLSPAGLRVLAGTHDGAGALQRGRFWAGEDLIDEAQAAQCTAILDEMFGDALMQNVRTLPPATLAVKSFEDTLPKVGRMWSVPLADEASRYLAKHCGLWQMIHSPSLLRFCEALAGEKLVGPRYSQVLAFQRGDYSGPHTDHHPEEPLSRHGYVDVHFTFSTEGVEQQFIAYERDGHFADLTPIAASGTVTAYRLPVWHYTTPLVTRGAHDRRWLVLASFALESVVTSLASQPQAPAEP